MKCLDSFLVKYLAFYLLEISLPLVNYAKQPFNLIQLAPKRALLKDFYDFASEYSDNSASLNEIALSRFTSPVPDETIVTIF